MTVATVGDKCPSCGVAYIDHPGLILTCKELQETKAHLAICQDARIAQNLAFDYLAKQCKAAEAERDRYREALERQLEMNVMMEKSPASTLRLIAREALEEKPCTA
jgi:short subunit dehydrogenase-like uncharacterized protein